MTAADSIVLAAPRTVVWFSCGAASAVAAKIVSARGACEVVYCDTMATEHPDNARFFADVQAWIGQPITVLRSSRFTSIDDVYERVRFMSSPHGARCTAEMKKVPRVKWQLPTDTHVFGYTSDEAERAEKFEDNNPELACEWVLIDQRITKEDCYSMLSRAGVALPAMYALGFDHNNCLGCVKATSPGYWNRTRRLFPEVFDRRARQSRAIGCRLARIGDDVRVFLDELDPDLGGADDAIECGPACQTSLPWVTL